MRKIGKYYIVPESEIETINWLLEMLDRHREQDKKEHTKHHEENSESDI